MVEELSQAVKMHLLETGRAVLNCYTAKTVTTAPSIMRIAGPAGFLDSKWPGSISYQISVYDAYLCVGLWYDGAAVTIGTLRDNIPDYRIDLMEPDSLEQLTNRLREFDEVCETSCKHVRR